MNSPPFLPKVGGSSSITEPPGMSTHSNGGGRMSSTRGSAVPLSSLCSLDDRGVAPSERISCISPGAPLTMIP
ncbi:MAG: hypothetical protein U0703_11335 [Anaerolineae bacterium]